MTLRTRQQKIGAFGHKWLTTHIEEHPAWLSRDLGEDYGVDIEAELTAPALRGHILKIQIKSHEHVERKDHRVKLVIDKKYIDYAESCRYPVILAVVDTTAKQAWYLWLQEWLLLVRSTQGRRSAQQTTWTQWISETQTVERGLSAELQSIAEWKGETQLTLSLIDALRAAAATQNRAVIEALVMIISNNVSTSTDASLDVLIDEAVQLGNRLRGTSEGNLIADQLYALARKHGGRISRFTVHDLVIREDSYSRTGLTTLGIMYDDFFDHIRSLCLPSYFTSIEARVAFYCAFREAFPEVKSGNFAADPTGFTFAGLQYLQPDRHLDKYINRGPSALLDYLVPLDLGNG
jgi:hypothetical protein